ncbi:hypothetical protein IFM89_000517 [Coptis chinensis]|uniref:Pseudouridine synthase RsuA/RluA-like domain-containing protein n=1 Tax=Coptis chinensis TaxID=261450 RepID=A0A835H3A5_9MAGN|nr:hypothetical protein IFM89_000517 [Coptis chinensis]
MSSGLIITLSTVSFLGILLCAKTKLAKVRLAAYFAYGTSVVGDKRDDTSASVLCLGFQGRVVISQPIGVIQYPGVANGLYVALSSGKPALSKVKVLERNVEENHSLVQVEIQTGRPHQIRIHLSFLGHPLLGNIFIGHTFWQQRIRNGQITFDGEVVTDPDTCLRAGSVLVYHRLPWKEPDAPYLLQVLFEDDDLVALNKPSGLQVLPGGSFQQRTVLTQLQWRVKKQRSQRLAGNGALCGRDSNPVPVHRLGRGTSGILLCAKTKLQKFAFVAYFAYGTSVVGDKRITNLELNTTRKISKIYRALVTEIIEENQVVISQPIGVIQYPGVANGLYVALSSGKPALSKVKVLERNVEENHSLVQKFPVSWLVKIFPAYGESYRLLRTGDPLYVTGGHPNCFDFESSISSCAHDGGYQRPMKPVPGDCGYYLHAYRLVLDHPTTNEKFVFTGKFDRFQLAQVNINTVNEEKTWALILTTIKYFDMGSYLTLLRLSVRECQPLLEVPYGESLAYLAQQKICSWEPPYQGLSKPSTELTKSSAGEGGILKDSLQLLCSPRRIEIRHLKLLHLSPLSLKPRKKVKAGRAEISSCRLLILICHCIEFLGLTQQVKESAIGYDPTDKDKTYNTVVKSSASVESQACLIKQLSD